MQISLLLGGLLSGDRMHSLSALATIFSALEDWQKLVWRASRQNR